MSGADMAMPSEQTIQNYFLEARREVEQSLTEEMLQAANQACFRRCFHNGTRDAATPPNANPVSGSTTSADKQCLTSCLDKYLEARTIAFKKLIKETNKRS